MYRYLLGPNHTLPPPPAPLNKTHTHAPALFKMQTS